MDFWITVDFLRGISPQGWVGCARWIVQTIFGMVVLHAVCVELSFVVAYEPISSQYAV